MNGKRTSGQSLRLTGHGLLLLVLLVGLVPFPSAATPPDRIAGQAAAPSPAVQPGPWEATLTNAYVRDIDLGGGQRQVLVSNVPINYQAADGSWLPIDPRFAAVPGGFINRTNSLVISTAERQAALRLQSGSTLVGWEAQGLVRIAADGAETVLARPLAGADALTGTLSADGSTIHYAQGWTFPGLGEEVTAGPGQVEQSLLLAAPFPWAEAGRPGESGFLVLQATLFLFPGTEVYAGGIQRTTAFSTTGAVELRNSQGGIVLALPRALEQANPGVSVAGRYRLTPLDDGTWQVAVETPWSWWADPARVGPLVLDPTMQVLQPTTVQAVYSGSDSATCFGWALDPADPLLPCAAVGCRPECQGLFRTLVRFNNLPKLPPGYAIEEAELRAVPVSGYYAPLPDGTPFFATLGADVRRVLGDWDPSSVSWSNYPAVDPTPLDASQTLSVYPPWAWQKTGGKPIRTGAGWTLQAGPTGVVSDWLDNSQVNHGLELRAADESDCLLNRRTFVEIPTVSSWSDDDLDFPPDIAGLLGDGGGFMLLITYAPPTLPDGTPYDWSNLPEPPSTPAGIPGAPYARTYHTYLPPASSSPWTAVAAKSFQQTVVGTRTLYLASGVLPVDVDCEWTTCGTGISTGAIGKPNYYLIRGDPAVPAHEFQVYPSNADYNQYLTHYLVESRSSVPFSDSVPLFPVGTVATRTVVMSTFEVLRVYDLNLVESTNVGAFVSGTGTERVEARVFPPFITDLPRNAQQSRSASSWEVGSGQAGSWALVLDYMGDATPAEGPEVLTLTVVVRACSSGATPTPEGCYISQRPTASTSWYTVGPYIVYSDAGFDQDPFTHWWTTRKKGTDGNYYASYIGWAASGDTSRLVAVAGGTIRFFNEAPPWELRGDDWGTAVALEYFDAPTGPPAARWRVWTGTLRGYPNASDPPEDYGYLRPVAWREIDLPLEDTDIPNAEIKIDVQGQYVEGAATLYRNLETGAGSWETFSFDLSWHGAAEGYDGIGYIYPLGTLPAQADVGSLIYLFGDGYSWSIDFDRTTNPPLFTNIRNQGRIAMPDSLGAAWKPAQAVIPPKMRGLPAAGGGFAQCPPGYCLDVRAPDDSLTYLHREWDMPDVTVGGMARTIIYEQPGEVAVYSSDHPEATLQGLPFSFRAFSGKVAVSRKVCPPTPYDQGSNGQVVTVIEGKASFALPGLGGDLVPSEMIDANFTLCQGKVRSIVFAVQGLDPGIPVGSTGVWVNSVAGTIAIDPDHTTIDLSIGYQSGPEGDLLNDGTASVRIDTAGLFDLQARGLVVNAVSFYGHVWVAWNPLDIGVDVSVSYPADPDDWKLWGHVYGHLWQGQGWQHRYWWLPDDASMHFTASIDAGFFVKAGAAFNWYFLKIPPMNISFSIWIAFGEFCIEDCPGCGPGCYEWGFKGGFSILGYDVGFYYGFDSGIDFILGSDGHVLVDLYVPGSQGAQASCPLGEQAPLVGGRPANLHRVAVPNDQVDQYSYPITITSDSGSAFVGLAWENLGDSPALTLRTPLGEVISPTNAAEYGITVKEEPAARTYYIPGGALGGRAGTWYADIANAAPDDCYHLVFFANKGAPDVNLLTPATPLEPGSMTTPYTIYWSVPGGLPSEVDYRISLYYTATNAGELTTTQHYGGVIVENLPLSDGQYDWDLSFLGTGTYSVYARLASGGPGLIQPPPTITGTDQIPMVVKIDAPGSISLVDTQGPAVPTGLTLSTLDEALRACWDPNPDHDLSSYQLTYWATDVYGNYRAHSFALPATVPFPPPAGEPQECARIGGLNAGDGVTVEVSAYDASGNSSGPGPAVFGTVVADVLDYPPSPGTLNAFLVVNHNIVFTWTGVVTPGLVSGYYLHYALDHPAGPGQPGTGAIEGDSPIDVGTATDYLVSGLLPGRVYYFVVQPYDAERRVGPLSNLIVYWITDGVDVNPADGIPDDWQYAYDLIGRGSDADRDCLDNYTEFWTGAHPRLADTDGDGFADGEEYGYSDILDRHSYPGNLAFLPKMSLNPRHLTFLAGTGNGSPPQWVRISDMHGGVLTAAASASVPWLTLQVGEDRLMVEANTSGLAPGYYTGTLTITGTSSLCTLDSPQIIPVELWLLAGTLPQYDVYLPLVLRNGH